MLQKLYKGSCLLIFLMVSGMIHGMETMINTAFSWNDVVAFMQQTSDQTFNVCVDTLVHMSPEEINAFKGTSCLLSSLLNKAREITDETAEQLEKRKRATVCLRRLLKEGNLNLNIKNDHGDSILQLLNQTGMYTGWADRVLWPIRREIFLVNRAIPIGLCLIALISLYKLYTSYTDTNDQDEDVQESDDSSTVTDGE